MRRSEVESLRSYGRTISLVCSSSHSQSLSPEMCNIRLLILVIIIISCNLIGCMWGMIMIDDQLGEGDQCTLENDDLGVCKKLPECPPRLKDVQDGKTWDPTGRCGFDNFTEIVCCPVNVEPRIAPRPAEVACQQIRERRSYYEPTIKSINFYKTFGRLNLAYAPSDLISNVSNTDNAIPPYFTQTYKQPKSSYMVALGYKNEKIDENPRPIIYKCGGTLISSQHVLTAAHCVNNIDERVPVEVWFGSVNLFDLEGIRIPIGKIISHPQYRRSQYYNDVAILKLITDDVPNLYTPMPICLETKSVATVNITPSTRFLVLGWGVIAFGDDKSSHRLMQTPSLSLVNNEECNKSYREFTRKLPHGIDDSIICMVDANTTRMADACQGDSGGPLLMSTESEDRLIGITSFGHGCGSVDPGGYTAVYPFLEWIEEHVWPTTDRNEVVTL